MTTFALKGVKRKYAMVSNRAPALLMPCRTAPRITPGNSDTGRWQVGWIGNRRTIKADPSYARGPNAGMLRGVTYARPNQTTETIGYSYTALGQKPKGAPRWNPGEALGISARSREDWRQCLFWLLQFLLPFMG